MNTIGYILNFKNSPPASSLGKDFPNDRGKEAPANYSTTISTLFRSLNVEIGNTFATGSTPPSLLSWLYQQSDGYQAVLLADQHSRFYNLKVNQTLLENFFRYHADIGFGDNFPKGVVFFILRREILPVLENIRLQNKIVEDEMLIENLIAVDVNAFTLENLYAKHNLSSLRLSFLENCAQNVYTTTQLASAMEKASPGKLPSQWNFDKLAALINENRNLLKTIPSFYEWHILSQGTEKKIYSPTNSTLSPSPVCKLGPMDLELFMLVLKKVVAFSPHATVQLSATIGEPTLHPQWEKFVLAILQQNLDCVLETYGKSVAESTFDRLLAHTTGLKIVFKLDAIDNRIYRVLHGEDIPTGLVRKVENLLLKHPKNTYVETIKIDETVDHLQKFYTHFQKFTKNIIIGKYNPFRGRLKERRKRVMEPLQKIDCWHLKRDVVIDASADVWLCKQDIEKKHCLGNLAQHSLQEIFNAGQQYYSKHLNGFAFCNGCDEYYTFNF